MADAHATVAEAGLVELTGAGPAALVPLQQLGRLAGVPQTRNRVLLAVVLGQDDRLQVQGALCPPHLAAGREPETGTGEHAVLPRPSLTGYVGRVAGRIVAVDVALGISSTVLELSLVDGGAALPVLLLEFRLIRFQHPDLAPSVEK